MIFEAITLPEIETDAIIYFNFIEMNLSQIDGTTGAFKYDVLFSLADRFGLKLDNHFFMVEYYQKKMLESDK